MSEENVELVRRWYRSLPDLRDTNPDNDRLPAGYPEGEPVFRGREGVTQLLAMLRDAWAEWRLEPERFLDADDRVVVFIRVVAKGGASGVPIELKDAPVVTVRDGRLRDTRVYRDRSEALEAAGLPPRLA